MKAESTAPGKVFLSGEYLALDGSLATILTTKQRALVTIEKTQNSTNTLCSLPSNQTFAFNVNNKHKVEWVGDDPQELGLFLKWSILEMQIRPTKTRFTIDTTDFYKDNKKIGLGSSAAISSALIQAIVKYFDIKYNDEMILNSSLRVHNTEQNNLGSGLDVIAAHADSELIECDIKTLSKGKWATLEWPSDLIIKGVITRKESKTVSMIRKYLNGQTLHKEFFEKLQNDVNQVLKGLSLSWLDHDISSILELMEQYNILMQRLNEKYNLGIYTDDHQELAKLANKLGLFYKPSGAGGGDLGVILTEDSIKLKQLLTQIRDKRYQTIDLRA